MLRFPFLILCFCGLMLTSAYGNEQGGTSTLWPLVDYRTSPEIDYSSLHLLGPLLKFETKGAESEFALRPLFYRAADRQGVSQIELLYPLAALKKSTDQTSFQLLQLLSFDSGATEQDVAREFMVFPLFFYRQSEKQDDYLALFPLGGKILGRFWRDEIRFTLFPLYAQTRKGTTTTTNLFWPFLSRMQGEGETGVALWPLFGHSQKTGVYRKRFYLWPLFFQQDLQLDTETPTQLRAVFPFYVSEDSRDISSRTLFWPFFSHHVNRATGTEEWNFPMPLVRVTRGESRHGNRFLPLFADESVGSNRKRWFFWPLYKIEETHTDILDRRRDRLFFFLYSNLSEQRKDEAEPYKRRIALWPLFSYQKVKTVSQFHLFSLMEPFFPENKALERNWSPLWRLYQRKWDEGGNSVSTFLWNLYWQEKRGDDLALELFPLFAYTQETGKGSDLSFLKGFFRYRCNEGETRINLLYLPWSISWGQRPLSPAKVSG